MTEFPHKIENVVAVEDGAHQVVIDGKPLVVPADPGNRHRRILAEWAAVGNDLPTYTPPDPLEIERAGMSAWKRAFRQALRLFPHPQARTQFDAIKLAIASGQAPDGMAEAWDEVAEFQRTHPDTIAFGQALGFDAESLDALFRVAMQIEAGTPVSEIVIPN